MNTSVNELLSNPAFRPLVLLDVLAVFLMIICLVFRRMRKGYYVEQANDARKISVVSISSSRYVGQMLDVEHEHVTSLRPGEHFYQLVVPCAGMALIIAGPNGWACFGTRILIAAALQ